LRLHPNLLEARYDLRTEVRVQCDFDVDRQDDPVVSLLASLDQDELLVSSWRAMGIFRPPRLPVDRSNSAYSQGPNVHGTTTFGVVFLAVPSPTIDLTRLFGW
jgi:hypothetical protein